MPEYLIEWTIELDAESPEEAARLALAIQRYPDSLATVFKVYGEDAEGVTIDVTDLDEESEAEEERTFINHYVCPRCGYEWTDSWTAMCDDDCPACGLRHISPHESGDV